MSSAAVHLLGGAQGNHGLQEHSCPRRLAPVQKLALALQPSSGVPMCVCVCVCGGGSVRAYLCMCVLYVCVHIYVCMCVHACVYVCVRVSEHLH